MSITYEVSKVLPKDVAAIVAEYTTCGRHPLLESKMAIHWPFISEVERLANIFDPSIHQRFCSDETYRMFLDISYSILNKDLRGMLRNGRDYNNMPYCHQEDLNLLNVMGPIEYLKTRRSTKLQNIFNRKRYRAPLLNEEDIINELMDFLRENSLDYPVE